MASKQFMPKNASSTKADIWQCFYSKECNVSGLPWFEYATMKDVKTPAYVANELPDALCQKFVNEQFDVLAEGMDEEDRADAMSSLEEKYHKLFLSALKR